MVLDLEETNKEAFFYALSLLNLDVMHMCTTLGVSVQFLQIPDTIGNLLRVVKTLKDGLTGSEYQKECDKEIDFDKLLRYQRFLYQVAPQDRSPELLEKALAPPPNTEDEWQIL